MTPLRAPVSARALSTTSRSTVSRSRVALMRRMAALRVDMDLPNVWFSRPASSDCDSARIAARPDAEITVRHAARKISSLYQNDILAQISHTHI